MSHFDDPAGAMPPAPEPEPDPRPGSAPPAVQAPHEKLDGRVVIYWIFSGVLSWLFLAMFLGGGAVMVYTKFPGAWIYMWPGVIALGGSLLVWALISPSLAYARWRYSVDTELLLARYGIFFIEEKAIPISRLQHVDLYRGLLERFFGLTTLIVFTAGTEGAHFRLPGLSVERARELRDLILAARGDDVI